jgi:hypothetical protein
MIQLTEEASLTEAETQRLYGGLLDAGRITGFGMVECDGLCHGRKHRFTLDEHAMPR